jgi:meso-butanediol dehydrogenase / (S,S)-butanediol dehydrogenase / diacetyl reductase
MSRLAGKVALITGGGSGMGRSCMEIFAREGATVVGLGRRPEPLDEVCEAVRAAGGTASGISCDIADEAAVEAAVDAVLGEHGRVDALVNCAGIGGNSYRTLRDGGMNPLGELPTEFWDEMVRNNLFSAFYLSRRMVNEMRKAGGGSIVHVTSTAAVEGFEGAHGYAVAKAGVANMCRQMARAYGRFGIRTNCVVPGYTDTPMMEGTPLRAMVAEDNPARFEKIAMGRAAHPDEIAYGCLFMACDESSYVNGASLVIDGGWLCCPS